MAEAESAIQCFEKVTGLPVVVHDLTHTLWHQLPITRFRHVQSACLQVKNDGYDHRCTGFEITDFRREAAAWPQGRFHQCHAGMVEAAVPVFEQTTLILVLFAGPARLAKGDQPDVIAPASRAIAARARLPLIRKAERPTVQELLRQLGARIKCLLQESGAGCDIHHKDATRRAIIEHFLIHHHPNPIAIKDLAHALGIGTERCRHVIKETFGISFSTLLKDTRIRSACALLLNTQLSVAEIAERCGMPDPSGFTRAFRHNTGMSPGRWRRQQQMIGS